VLRAEKKLSAVVFAEPPPRLGLRFTPSSIRLYLHSPTTEITFRQNQASIKYAADPILRLFSTTFAAKLLFCIVASKWVDVRCRQVLKRYCQNCHNVAETKLPPKKTEKE